MNQHLLSKVKCLLQLDKCQLPITRRRQEKSNFCQLNLCINCLVERDIQVNHFLTFSGGYFGVDNDSWKELIHDLVKLCILFLELMYMVRFKSNHLPPTPSLPLYTTASQPLVMALKNNSLTIIDRNRLERVRLR